MKTLHFFHHSDLKNGVDKSTCTLIVALKKLGVEPAGVVSATGEVTDYLDAQGIVYRIIPYACCASHSKRAQLRFYAKSFGQQKSLLELMKLFQPDVVHLNTGHLLYAGLVAAKCAVPAIWHIHSPFEEDLSRYESSIGPEGYRWLLQQLASRIIGVSNDVSQSLSEKLPHEMITTLYNGVDIDELALAAQAGSTNIRQELGLLADCEIVLGVGRISAQKDFAAFTRVAALVLDKRPGVQFVIAGPLQEQAAVELLQREIHRLNLNRQVHVLGSRSDIPSLMCQSNLLLSTAVFEGQGIVALEAMALHTPVIAMACVGLRECIQHEVDGLLVLPGDEIGAAESVLRVLNTPELAAKLASAGQQTVETRFSSDQYCKSFLKIAREAISYGPARMTAGELAIIQGLLGEIHEAHNRLLHFETQTPLQRVRSALWSLYHRA